MTRKKLSLLERILEITLIFLIAIIVILVLVQVFSRYLVQLPFIGIEEIARLLFVWACLLGTALGVVQNRHISIDVLLRVFPKNLKHAAGIISQLMILFISGVMVVYGTQFTISKWAYPDYSTALFYPRSLFYMPVPISGAIIFVYTLIEMPKKLFNNSAHTEPRGS